MEPVEQGAERLATPWPGEPDLAALIGRMARGDQDALAALYDATSSTVYGLAVAILHDQSAAEEVTIEAYTQVYRQAASYDAARGTPRAWLVTLTRSRAIDRARVESTRRQRQQPLEAIAGLASAAPDPEEASLLADRGRLVRAALANLTPEQRQVIEIAYYSGLSHREIAARLGQPVGTVKTRIRTGMMRLREYLRPLLTEDPA